ELVAAGFLLCPGTLERLAGCGQSQSSAPALHPLAPLQAQTGYPDRSFQLGPERAFHLRPVAAAYSQQLQVLLRYDADPWPRPAHAGYTPGLERQGESGGSLQTAEQLQTGHGAHAFFTAAAVVHAVHPLPAPPQILERQRLVRQPSDLVHPSRLAGIMNYAH